MTPRRWKLIFGMASSLWIKAAARAIRQRRSWTYKIGYFLTNCLYKGSSIWHTSILHGFSILYTLQYFMGVSLYLHFLGWSAVLGLWHLVRFATGPSYCHWLAWLEDWNCMSFQIETWAYIHLIWWVPFAGIVSSLNAVAVARSVQKAFFARFGTLLHTCHLYHHLCLKYTFCLRSCGDLFTFIVCFRYPFLDCIQ